jgi:hypothetical protein
MLVMARRRPVLPERRCFPMQMQMTITAAEHERFAPGAFDRTVGSQVPVNLRETDGGPVLGSLGTGTVTAADVAEDGTSVTLTVEVDGVSLGRTVPPDLSPFSFRFTS